MIRFAFTLLFLLSFLITESKDSFKKCLLKKIDGITSIEVLDDHAGFKGVYDIRLKQPLDHNNPSNGYFEQRIYLYHKDRRKPVVYVTEGYALRDRVYELCHILDANQIAVEYRYYGVSLPKERNWTFLNNNQAVEDLHRIRELFGKIFKEEWISTGISKGGTTTMIYKAIYPNDVDASVNYVGPLPLDQEDRRMDKHILSIGDEECRKDLEAFQIEALKRRERMLPKVDSLAKSDELSFSIGMGAALEYAVLEYTFSFWQFAHDCSQIPNSSASDERIFNHLNEIVGFNFYSDATFDLFEPAFYQFMTENGYYGFIYDFAKPYLIDVKSPTNLTFTPKDVKIEFNKNYMEQIKSKLDKYGDKVIHIHGEYDPWGAVGYVPPPDQDSRIFIKEAAGHRTRIADLNLKDQAQVYFTLSRWLDIEVNPLEPKS